MESPYYKIDRSEIFPELQIRDLIHGTPKGYAVDIPEKHKDHAIKAAKEKKMLFSTRDNKDGTLMFFRDGKITEDEFDCFLQVLKNMDGKEITKSDLTRKTQRFDIETRNDMINQAKREGLITTHHEHARKNGKTTTVYTKTF